MNAGGFLARQHAEAVGRLAERARQLLGLARRRQEEEAVDRPRVAPDRHAAQIDRGALLASAAHPAGRRLEPVHGKRLDIAERRFRRPLLLQVSGHGPARLDRRRVEQDGRALVVLRRDLRVAVDQPEAFGHAELEAQHRMLEQAAAHDSLPRVVAEQHAVDIVEIGLAPDAGLGGPGGGGFLHRLVDTLDRARMRRHDVVFVHRSRRQPLHLGLDDALLAQRAEERHHALRVIAGAAHVADAERVRFELLRARVGLDRHGGDRLPHLHDFLRQAEGGRADRARQKPELRHLDRRQTLGGVARVDVADLMRNDAGQLRFVARQDQQAARHVDEPARQREGIDDRGVEDRELVGKLLVFGEARQRLADPVDIALQLAVLVLAAEFLDDLRVLFAPKLDVVFRGIEAGEARPPGRAVDRGAGRQSGAQRGGRHARKKTPAVVLHHAPRSQRAVPGIDTHPIVPICTN